MKVEFIYTFSCVLRSRARELVVHVDRYFENERDETKALLKELTQLLNKAGNSSHVLLSKKLLSDIVIHFRNATKVTELVVAATGVCKNTVAKIRSENKTCMASGNKIKTPTKKKRDSEYQL